MPPFVAALHGVIYASRESSMSASNKVITRSKSLLVHKTKEAAVAAGKTIVRVQQAKRSGEISNESAIRLTRMTSGKLVARVAAAAMAAQNEAH